MKRMMNMMVVKTLVLFVMLFLLASDVKAYEEETVTKPTLTPAVMTTSFANDKNATIERYQTTDGYSCYIVPISCKKRGWVCMELDTTIPNGMYYYNNNIGMRLYLDKACKKPVGTGQYKYMQIREFLQNKTYYLKIEKSASYGVLNLKLKCYEYSTENTTMKENGYVPHL